MNTLLNFPFPRCIIYDANDYKTWHMIYIVFILILGIYQIIIHLMGDEDAVNKKLPDKNKRPPYR